MDANYQKELFACLLRYEKEKNDKNSDLLLLTLFLGGQSNKLYACFII